MRFPLPFHCAVTVEWAFPVIAPRRRPGPAGAWPGKTSGPDVTAKPHPAPTRSAAREQGCARQRGLRAGQQPANERKRPIGWRSVCVWGGGGVPNRPPRERAAPSAPAASRAAARRAAGAEPSAGGKAGARSAGGGLGGCGAINRPALLTGRPLGQLVTARGVPYQSLYCRGQAKRRWTVKRQTLNKRCKVGTDTSDRKERGYTVWSTAIQMEFTCGL